MPVVTPDFEEKKLPPGDYRARIVSCEQKEGPNAPYLNWKFETVNEKQWVFLMTGLSGKGAQVFKSIVRAAFDPNYESGTIDTDTLNGCEVMITVDKGINKDGSESKYMAVTAVTRLTDSEIPF